MKIKLLALFGFILLSTPLAATAQQFGDFTYTSDGSAITITSYTGPGGAVTIPDTITGLPVAEIGMDAFGYVTNLASATVPGSVVNIDAGAFYSCTSLTNITLLNGLVSIGYGAFALCLSLTDVTVPGSVTNIDNTAFSYCPSLNAITVDPASRSYSSADGVLFNKTQTTLIECPRGKAGGYPIPGSVTNIGSYAFYYCTGLTSIILPRSVTSIGSFAFYECVSLVAVFFKGNAPSVDSSAFDYTSTIYYLPGTVGWPGPLYGRTVLWNPLMQPSGVGPSGFGLNITGTADIPIVIEAAPDLANATWTPLQSLNLTNGAFHFSDPNWTNYPTRFYRIRSP